MAVVPGLCVIVGGAGGWVPTPVRSPKHVQSESHLGSAETRPGTSIAASGENMFPAKCLVYSKCLENVECF